MFYVDKPELEVKPFKIGDRRFWKESNADWEKQLEKFKNIPTCKIEDWNRFAKKRWAQDKKEQKQEVLEDEDTDGKTVTNDVNLAPPEVQQQYMQDWREANHMNRSAWEQAKENISNEKLYNYKSGVGIITYGSKPKTS